LLSFPSALSSASAFSYLRLFHPYRCKFIRSKGVKRQITQYRHIFEAASTAPRYPSRIFNEPAFLYYGRQARETAMKPSLCFAVLLLFASSAQAQHSHSHATGGGNSAGSGYGQGGWGSGWGSSSFGSHSGRVAYEPPRDYSIGYAKNDGPFVPSTYMNYDDALALGQRQLSAEEKAARGDEGTPLGDIARDYRASRIPTLRLQSRVLQDNSGNLQVCNLNGNNCHRP